MLQFMREDRDLLRSGKCAGNPHSHVALSADGGQECEAPLQVLRQQKLGLDVHDHVGGVQLRHKLAEQRRTRDAVVNRAAHARIGCADVRGVLCGRRRPEHREREKENAETASHSPASATRAPC